jgi:pectinesterase
VFELTYDAWDAAGTQVSEVKRFTVDAGHNLDQIESTFTVAAGGPKEITVAIGLNKTPADKNQDASVALTSSAATGTLTQWVTQKTNGELGTALIMPTGAFVGFTADSLNELILAKVTTGQPLRYYAGAGWSKAGEFKSQADWNTYVAACATRAASPIKITVASK